MNRSLIGLIIAIIVIIVAVAEKIAKNLNADIFEIVPEDVYTSEDLNWNNSNSRVSKEHDDEFLRNVKLKNTKVNNWEEYDTVKRN